MNLFAFCSSSSDFGTQQGYVAGTRCKTWDDRVKHTNFVAQVPDLKIKQQNVHTEIIIEVFYAHAI